MRQGVAKQSSMAEEENSDMETVDAEAEYQQLRREQATPNKPAIVDKRGRSAVWKRGR